jgi:predicted outer membrane protein
MAALSSSDSSYLTAAMQTQLGRYALATLAQKNASSSAVKSLARSIATQSGTDSNLLNKIAKQNGVPVATQPDMRFSYHYSQLTGLHGKSFDRQFVQELQVDDQFASSTDQGAMNSVKSAQLRAFAKRRYSSLQKELKTLSNLHV